MRKLSGAQGHMAQHGAALKGDYYRVMIKGDDQ